MKEFEVYSLLDDDGQEVSLDGSDSDSNYLLDTIYAETLEEAQSKSFQEYGNCIVRWIRKNGSLGYGDYEVNKI